MSAVILPAGLTLLERGWLSSNNVFGVDGQSATLIDSGYFSHAAQTLALVQAQLDRCGLTRLTRLINTHSHSDHLGGNQALQAAHACEIVLPAGMAAMVTQWDETALLLTPLGQRAARFRHDATLAAGDCFVMAGLEWTALAAPGHDPHALIYYASAAGVLISGDALWENGFGVVFSSLLGDPLGLAQTRQTLERIGRLSLRTVLPGHGPAFVDVDQALSRALSRLDAFVADRERLARHALKVLLVFLLLDRRQIRAAALAELLGEMPFAREVAAVELGWSPEVLAEWLLSELVGSGSLRLEQGWLRAV